MCVDVKQQGTTCPLGSNAKCIQGTAQIVGLHGVTGAAGVIGITLLILVDIQILIAGTLCDKININLQCVFPQSNLQLPKNRV